MSKTIIYILLAACLSLSTGCQKEKCSFCEVLGHKEIYIGEICGTEDFVKEQIEHQRKLYPNYDLRCW